MTSADPTARTGRDTARRVIPLFRPYRGRVVMVVSLIVLTSTIGIVNPLLIQAVFNKALFVPGGPKLDLLYILVAIMAAVPIINGGIGILQVYETTKVGQSVMRDLRDRLYAHLQTLSLAFFTGTKTGEIQSRLANDVGGVQTVVTTTASTILANTAAHGASGCSHERRSRAARKVRKERSVESDQRGTCRCRGAAKVRQQARNRRYRQENQRLPLEVRQQMIGRASTPWCRRSCPSPAAIYWSRAAAAHGNPSARHRGGFPRCRPAVLPDRATAPGLGGAALVAGLFNRFRVPDVTRTSRRA